MNVIGWALVTLFVLATIAFVIAYAAARAVGLATGTAIVEGISRA